MCNNVISSIELLSFMHFSILYVTLMSFLSFVNKSLTISTFSSSTTVNKAALFSLINFEFSSEFIHQSVLIQNKLLFILYL